MKKWYVYKVSFEDGSFYYGYRGAKTPAEDFLKKYFTSSKEVLRRIEENESYSGEIILEFDNQKDALDYEQEIIFLNFNDPLILNQSCKFGAKGFGMLTTCARNKISKTSKERWNSNEYREKIKISQINSWTKERKTEQSKRLKGKKRPEHSEQMKGRSLNPTHPFFNETKTPKHKENISKALLGKTKSDDHKNNLKNSISKRTSEQWADIKKKRRENLPPKFEINGIQYVSLQEAAEHFNLSAYKVAKLITLWY